MIEEDKKLISKHKDIHRVMSNNRAVMGGNKQMKNCSRMSIIGHMFGCLLAGMVVGYSLTVNEIDRDALQAEVNLFVDKVDYTTHFLNETNRMWKGIQMEAAEIDINDYEYRCLDHGLYPEVLNANTTIVENVMIPFKRHFDGVTDSFMPAVDYVVKLNPQSVALSDEVFPFSQTTFWNLQTRSDMIAVQFEDRAPHKWDKKRICYFVFQREKRRK